MLSLFAALSVLISSAPVVPLSEVVCQGCESTATYSTSNAGCVTAGWDAGLLVTILQYDGGCANVDEACVTSIPCTPSLTIEAWVDDFGGGLFRSQGTIGGVGTGRVDNPASGMGPSYPVKVYSDYSGVDCGSGLDFHFNVAFYEELWWWPGVYDYVCTWTASGRLNCSACVPCNEE